MKFCLIHHTRQNSCLPTTTSPSNQKTPCTRNDSETMARPKLPSTTSTPRQVLDIIQPVQINLFLVGENMQIANVLLKFRDMQLRKKKRLKSDVDFQRTQHNNTSIFWNKWNVVFPLSLVKVRICNIEAIEQWKFRRADVHGVP